MKSKREKKEKDSAHPILNYLCIAEHKCIGYGFRNGTEEAKKKRTNQMMKCALRVNRLKTKSISVEWIGNIGHKIVSFSLSTTNND